MHRAPSQVSFAAMQSSRERSWPLCRVAASSSSLMRCWQKNMSFQHEAEVLAELTEGKVWFWFAGAEQAGNAVLLLDADRGQLKSRARELEVTGAVLRGH